MLRTPASSPRHPLALSPRRPHLKRLRARARGSTPGRKPGPPRGCRALPCLLPSPPGPAPPPPPPPPRTARSWRPARPPRLPVRELGSRVVRPVAARPRGRVTRAAGGAGGSARPGAAPSGTAPPRQRQVPRTPAAARLPRRQGRRAAPQHPQAPGGGRAAEAAATGAGNSGLAGPGSACAARPGPSPVGAAAVPAARLGAHGGPSAAGARAEPGEARQHPAPPAPSGAGRVPARSRPGGGRRPGAPPARPSVAALPASASRSWGRGGPRGRSVRRGAGGSWGAPVALRSTGRRRLLRGSGGARGLGAVGGKGGRTGTPPGRPALGGGEPRPCAPAGEAPREPRRPLLRGGFLPGAERPG